MGGWGSVGRRRRKGRRPGIQARSGGGGRHTHRPGRSFLGLEQKENIWKSRLGESRPEF